MKTAEFRIIILLRLFLFLINHDFKLYKEPVYSPRGDIMARSMNVDMSEFQMDFLDESEEEEDFSDIFSHFDNPESSSANSKINSEINFEEKSVAISKKEDENEMSKSLNRFCKAIDCINTISKYIETRRGKNEELGQLFDLFQVRSYNNLYVILN